MKIRSRAAIVLFILTLLVPPGQSHAAFQHSSDPFANNPKGWGTRQSAFQQASAANPAGNDNNNDTPEAHLGKGYEALKQDRYEIAASEFRAALALDPKLVLRARFPLAVALFELHQSEEARHEFEAVRHEIGDHPNISYYLGRLDLDGRNFESAIANLSKAAVEPPFPDTTYYLGFAYFKQGDFPSAEKWLKQAAETNPGDSRVPYQLGQVYRKQGREEDARKAFALSEELHQRDDNEGRLKVECAQRLEQGPSDEARVVCEQLYDPNNPEKLTALGTIYGQHGDLEAALKCFRRAAELSPQSPQMQYNLALTYYQLNRFEEARAALNGAVTHWPDLFPLNALYGAVLVKLGQDIPAYEALRRANQLNPQDPATSDLLYRLTLGLGRNRQAAQQYSEALGYLEEAAKLRSQESEPHRRMAEIYAVTGRAAQAKAEQEQAERLGKSATPQ
jgi:tetratricopeptide (TPR) repeat protein